MQTESALELALFREFFQMSMLRFTCVAAETQYLEILSVIFVFHSVFVVYVKVFPICCTREVSSAMLAPPAALLSKMF